MGAACIFLVNLLLNSQPKKKKSPRSDEIQCNHTIINIRMTQENINSSTAKDLKALSLIFKLMICVGSFSFV